MTAQEISIYIAALSAVAASVSAIVNAWNTQAFRRQLRATTTDGCLSAIGALKAAVHKTIEHKENKIDPITPEQIRGAYDDTWVKWVAFYQAFRVAQRYTQKYDFDAPDQTSALLTQLRADLRDPNWIPGGEKDPRDIRAAIDAIAAKIQEQSGKA